MNLSSIFTTMYTAIMAAIASTMSGATGGIQSVVTPVLAIAATIYFIIIGGAVLRGAISRPIPELGWQVVKVGLVIFAVNSTGIWAGALNGAPATIISAVSNTSVVNAGGIFDTYMANTDALDTIEANREVADAQQNSVPVVGQIIQAKNAGIAYMFIMLVKFIAALSACVGFVILVFAQFALNIVLTLAPIFLACLLFPSTRGWFQSWINQAVNYVLLMVVISITCAFITSLATATFAGLLNYANASTTNTATGGAWTVAVIEVASVMTAIVYIIGTIFFFTVPSIAAGLSGGAQSAGHNFLAIGTNQVMNRIGRSGGRGGGNSGRSTTSTARTGGVVNKG